jgi:hypothetical protein
VKFEYCNLELSLNQIVDLRRRYNDSDCKCAHFNKKCEKKELEIVVQNGDVKGPEQEKDYELVTCIYFIKCFSMSVYGSPLRTIFLS